MNRRFELSGRDSCHDDDAEPSEDSPDRSQLFEADDPAWIAKQLKRSAELSGKKRITPYRSAMSALVFYINRSNKDIPAEQLKILEKAKDELRTLFQKQKK